MRIRKILALLVLLSLALANVASGAEPTTAIETLRDFYKSYFRYLSRGTPNVKGPTLAMSDAFSKAAKKNREICTTYSTSICGWASDGDAYLDAQEIGPKLSLVNTGIKFVEIKPGLVQVSLNVYPSYKDAAYDRTITYKMVREKGRWVMDDVMYSDGVSTVKNMEIENAETIANPDPDSPAGKKRGLEGVCPVSPDPGR